MVTLAEGARGSIGIWETELAPSVDPSGMPVFLLTSPSGNCYC